MSFGQDEDILITTEEKNIYKWDLKEKKLASTLQCFDYIASLQRLSNGRILTGDKKYLSIWNTVSDYCEIRITGSYPQSLYLDKVNLLFGGEKNLKTWYFTSEKKDSPVQNIGIYDL